MARNRILLLAFSPRPWSKSVPPNYVPAHVPNSIPSVQSVLAFLIILTSGLQLLVQRINYKRDLERIEKVRGEARSAAWGPKLVPNVGKRKVSHAELSVLPSLMRFVRSRSIWAHSTRMGATPSGSIWLSMDRTFILFVLERSPVYSRT